MRVIFLVCLALLVSGCEVAKFAAKCATISSRDCN